jgi:hypothetical protein
MFPVLEKYHVKRSILREKIAETQVIDEMIAVRIAIDLCISCSTQIGLEQR